MILKRKKRAAATPRITLTALIDTVLVLLVIFMVTVPVIQHAIKVRLPLSVTNDKQQNNSSSITVTIDARKKIYVADTPVTMATLKEIIQQQSADHKKVVFINADTSLSYGSVVAVVDTIKAAGVEHVVLATTKDAATSAQ
jgi:biopolymer transport protein ExbD